MHTEGGGGRALPLLTVMLLLAGSALAGAAIALDRPAQGQVTVPASAFVIPWTGYLERDGVPHSGNVAMQMTVRDEGGGGVSPITFPSQTVSVQQGRFSLIVQPGEEARSQLQQMVRPVMSLRVANQELFGARPLRVASSALQSGSSREPTFEAGISVTGDTSVGDGVVDGAVDITGGGTLSVGGDAVAERATVNGGVNVRGSLASIGGLHLVTGGNPTLGSAADVLRFMQPNDTDLMRLDSNGVDIPSRLLIGRTGGTEVQGGNGRLRLVSNRLRLQNNTIFVPAGRTTQLRGGGGGSNSAVHMPGGIEYDGVIRGLSHVRRTRTLDFLAGPPITITLDDYLATATKSNRRREVTLESSANHICMLSGMFATHEHKEYSCTVTQGPNDWVLIAEIPEPRGGVEIQCRAMCLNLGGQ